MIATDRQRDDGLVAAIIAEAGDRGALSDELHFAAADRAERHHLDHGTANVLRALTFPADAVVLEVGAGYGAVTRHLGERAATVHAIEPDAARADVVALRTADLAGVRVIAGMPAALPGGTEYDLAVVAAEYATPRLLRAVRESLRPAGAVCVAADDLLGRREVEVALRSAGLAVDRVLRCSPDHRVARAVLTDELVAEYPRLAAAVGDDEHGYMVLAGAAVLWPRDRLATYFNTAERAADWCTRADVVRTATGAEVRRTPLRPDVPPVAGISVRACTDEVVDAPTMPAVLLEEPWRAAELLTGWRDLLHAVAQDLGAALWDLVPHNVLVHNDVLRPIDLEWVHERGGVTEVLERGLLVLGHLLADAGWAGAADGSTMRELAGWLGVLVGLEPSFVDRAVDREVEFATVASCGSVYGTAEVSAAIRAVWQDRIDQRVVTAPRRGTNPR